MSRSRGTHTCSHLPGLSGGQSYIHSIYHYRWTYTIILMMSTWSVGPINPKSIWFTIDANQAIWTACVQSIAEFWVVGVQPHSSSYTNLRIGPWIHCPKGPKANYVFCHSTYATLCQSYTSYTCSIEKAYANAVLVAGANSTLGKRAQFPLPRKLSHTIFWYNLFLYCGNAFAM